MKIIIEIFEKKYSVEMDDDSKFEDFMEEVNNISKAMWSSDTVDKYWE